MTLPPLKMRFRELKKHTVTRWHSAGLLMPLVLLPAIISQSLNMFTQILLLQKRLS
jgi:hypothetical protein